MARRRKRKSRHDAVRQQNIVGVSLLVFALALIGGAVWYYFANPALALDKETYCPLVNTGDHSVTVVLIDTTDRLSPVQQQALLNEFQELKKTMNRFDRLEVFAVDHVTQNVLRPVFSLCNPGRGSEIDPLLGNPRLVEKKWREGFDGPLEEILRDMMGRDKANSSPIMESIQSVVVTSLARSLDSSAKPTYFIPMMAVIPPKNAMEKSALSRMSETGDARYSLERRLVLNVMPSLQFFHMGQ